MADPAHHGPDANDQEFFDRLNRERFDAAAVCERCKRRPPTDIMIYTNYCAVCRACRDYLLDSLARSTEESNG
jgi:hypothetical protein